MKRLKFEIGQQIKDFTVLSDVPKINKFGHKYWYVRCKCGKEYWIGGSRLNSKNKNFSCVDCTKWKGYLEFKIGQQIKDFTILSDVPKIDKFGHKCWYVRCKCGKEYWSGGSGLNSKNSHFCCVDCTKWKGYKDVSGHAFSRIRGSAKNKKLEFNLTIEYLGNLFEKQDTKCAFTGRILIFGNRKRINKIKTTASLDRIDSNKGYVEGNVQWVHTDINMLKSNYTDTEFISICEEIVNYQKGKSKFCKT